MEDNLSELSTFLSQLRQLLLKSHIVLPKNGEVKLYHHNGLDNFLSVGALFVSVIQHNYCKFIVAMLGGQSYPLHFHRIKDESYFVLYGDLKVAIEEKVHFLSKGDVINVPRRFTHSFLTRAGCVFEEVSTAYLNNDSIYADPGVQKMPREQKVTILPMSVLIDDCAGGENSD
jgi:N-acetylneuraminate synthase